MYDVLFERSMDFLCGAGVLLIPYVLLRLEAGEIVVDIPKAVVEPFEPIF